MDMSVWFLMGAALVFFMQCGFAMVEAGFTRAKNVGNITMKNLMDFSLGTPIFWVLGFGIMFGAAAMSLSSFCVVTNALRLNLLNIKDSRKDKKIRRKAAVPSPLLGLDRK